MTQPGYPDYERLSLSSGVLLGGATQQFSGNTLIFQGYVGNYPYINFFWSGGGGNRNYVVTRQFYTDATFAHQVAIAESVRSDTTQGYRQFSPLSPWMVMFVEADTLTPSTPATWAVYGCSGKSSAAAIGDVSQELFAGLTLVGANSSTATTTALIVPGPAELSVFAAPAGWRFELQRWSFTAQAYTTFWWLQGTPASFGSSFDVALPDAPIRIQESNLTGAAANLGMWLMPTLM